MIKFKKITMVNFMSYGAIPTIVDLDIPGTTLVLGEDLDHVGGTNGVGKTTVLNAIVYALYDKSISNTAKDKLVNNINQSKMEVIVEFEKNGKNYTIVRQRKMKVGATGNVTTLYEDGKDITLDSSDHTNEYIEQKILGIPYELFVRIVAFSATHLPFLELPIRSPYAANQTDIIEELFNLKTLSQKADALKLEIKDTDLALKIQIEQMNLIEKEHERHAKQHEAALKRVSNWEIQHVQEIQDIESRIKKLQSVDIDAQKKVFDSLAEAREIYNKSKLAKDNIHKIHGDLRVEINDIDNELKHLSKGECPRCLQKFKDKNINSIIDQAELKKIELAKIYAELTTTSLATTSYADQVKRFEKMLLFKTLEELLNSKGKIDQQKEKLAELQIELNPYSEALEELEAIVLEAIDMTRINELKDTSNHQKMLLKVLTNKDSFVRKALLNKNIPFLNQRLQKYLIDIGLHHNVEFTHEMTAKISQFGAEMDFDQLSNGQRARVNIAISFAFRDVLQSMHDSVNICMLDEVLDVGLDAMGVQAAAKMLKRKARDEKIAVYIISHRDEIDSAFDRKMTVQLFGGFSSIQLGEG
jgi:DNA repair exonuclease SbcCD ATPase subunit